MLKAEEQKSAEQPNNVPKTIPIYNAIPEVS
jgi:hypothetical protein